jgi:hypothetical protein
MDKASDEEQLSLALQQCYSLSTNSAGITIVTHIQKDFIIQIQ